MLTSAQVETVAYQTEDGELLSPEEFDRGDTYARPVTRYELDELQTVYADGYELDIPPHVEGCEYEPALYSDSGTELLEAYHYKGHGCTFNDSGDPSWPLGSPQS